MNLRKILSLFKKTQKDVKILYFDADKVYESSRLSADGIDVISTAFNNSVVIDMQIKLINKNLKGDYNLFICDNSSDEKIADEIFEICKKNDIAYYKVKTSPFNNEFLSHGSALNWAYQKIIKNRKNNFIFIDCDLFPIKPFNINEFLHYKIYGTYRKREETEHWYLWPGYAYFNYEVVKDKEVDFLPPPDAGGKMYGSICKYVDLKTLKFPSHSIVDIINNVEKPNFYSKYRNDSTFAVEDSVKAFFRDEFYRNCVEYIDDSWLHYVAMNDEDRVLQKNDVLLELLENNLNV